MDWRSLTVFLQRHPNTPTLTAPPTVVMAHQTHALPWNTLASLFRYKADPKLEPAFNDIVFLHKGTEPKEIDYFCRALATQVSAFATTERAKFPPSDAYRQRAEAWASEARRARPGTAVRPVFPDAVQARYFGPQDGSDADRFRNHLWGGDGLQRVEAWAGDLYAARRRYDDTLKLMMLEAAGAPPALSASPAAAAAAGVPDLRTELMESLLLLANHAEIRAQFAVFVTEPYGDYGLSRVPEEGLRSYVFANLLAALQDGGAPDVGAPGPARPRYLDLPSYRRMLSSVAGTYDGDPQNLMHWDFYLERSDRSWDQDRLRDVLADRAALADYLKALWRVLVVYVVVLREAGREPDMARYCKIALKDLFDMGFFIP